MSEPKKTVEQKPTADDYADLYNELKLHERNALIQVDGELMEFGVTQL